MGWIGCVRCKKFRRDLMHELLQERSARFPQSFVRQPNDPECTQIVRKTPKRQFRVQWGGSGVFVAKNSDTTLWHELLHLFGLFCTKFRKATKRSSMHPNRTKTHQNISLGSSGVDWVHSLRKIPKRLRARTFALVRPVLHRVS